MFKLAKSGRIDASDCAQFTYSARECTDKTCLCVFPDMDWSFVQHPTNMTVTQGENITVTCRPPHSSPTAQVSWFKNNQLFIPTDHVIVRPSGDLFFQRCVCSLKGNIIIHSFSKSLKLFQIQRVNTYLFSSVCVLLCVCVCVRDLVLSAASRNMTVGATSAELQTHSFKDFSPLNEPHYPCKVGSAVLSILILINNNYNFFLSGSSSTYQSVAQSSHGAPRSSSKARVQCIGSPTAHCKLAEERPFQTNRRQNCCRVS